MLLALIVLSATNSVNGDCDDGSKEDDSWFKKFGCQIKKGAEDTYQTVKKGAEDGYEAVKPLGEKIATSAKEFGNSVAKKYDEVKHKLTDEPVPIENQPAGHVAHEPTEKVPLAPIPGDSKPEVVGKTSTGEQINTQTTARTVEPEGFDDRFLFQTDPVCPPGQTLDHRNHCRPSV